MERNIGDQLNKAFEAYRNASIEKDNAKRELQQKTEYYERCTQKLVQQIEDQKKQISELKAQLSSATKHASGEVQCCETARRKQEVETLSPCDHHLDNSSSSHRTNHFLMETTECAVMPGASSLKNRDVLDTFQDIQGKFQMIQTLTRRQKYHLKRFSRGNDAANEQQFSMPIQCTDVTAERAEVPFSSAGRSEADEQLPSVPLASRGASPQDGDLVESLAKLSVKFPPSTDSEYEFLNSAPEKHMDLPVHRKGLVATIPAVTEEPSLELAMPFCYPGSPPSSSISSISSTPASHEGVRGPQQPLWNPELCNTAARAACADPHQSKSCAFCNADVPQDHMYSHLNSHFQNDASN